jgi:hypothetical protein
VRHAGGVPHIDRQCARIQALPGRVHLTLEIKLFLGAGKLFLHPLFSKLTALCRRLRLNTQGGKRIETRRLDTPGPLHQLLITLIIVGTESPLTGLLLQVLLCGVRPLC